MIKNPHSATKSGKFYSCFFRWVYKTIPENYKLWLWLYDYSVFCLSLWSEVSGGGHLRTVPSGFCPSSVEGLTVSPTDRQNQTSRLENNGEREKINNRAGRTSVQMLSCISMRGEKWRVFCKRLYRGTENKLSQSADVNVHVSFIKRSQQLQWHVTL